MNEIWSGLIFAFWSKFIVTLYAVNEIFHSLTIFSTRQKLNYTFIDFYTLCYNFKNPHIMPYNLIEIHPICVIKFKNKVAVLWLVKKFTVCLHCKQINLSVAWALFYGNPKRCLSVNGAKSPSRRHNSCPAPFVSQKQRWFFLWQIIF